MKKLRLDHEDLKVETFSTQDPALNRGTVMGHSYASCYVTCDPWYFCRTYEGTCHNAGCNSGLTSLCGTEQATDCPGMGECAPFTQGPDTCQGSCTDHEGCSFCGAVC